MKRNIIEEFMLIAQKRKGECLSTAYIDSGNKLKFRCEKGHVWYALPGNIRQGKWCPNCAGHMKKNIEDIRKIAAERGGKCLSDKYINSQTKLKWQCKEGHVWEAVPSSIVCGKSWCPKCQSKKLTIEEMQNIAYSRGGKCLSDKYSGVQHKLEWECSQGHRWYAQPACVKRGQWCRICRDNKKKLTIKEMKRIATERGGCCLSDKYINSQTKLKWQCKEGHVWEAVPNSIRQGNWCPYCNRNAKLTIEEMKKLAKDKEGECLSDKYVNSQTKLKWRCKNGHVWMAMPNDVKSGKWCAICSSGISERMCRKYFELIFNEEFPKSRPKWLISPLGMKMELDGYCEKLGLAFEYHGIQHYEETKVFHTERSLQKQKEYDILKRKLCKQNGVVLIEVPYTIKHAELQAYIIQLCKNNNIELPKDIKQVDYKSLNIASVNKMEELFRIAAKRGGRCLSDNYYGTDYKYRWQCEKGHVWEALIGNIRKGKWCPICSRGIIANKLRLPLSKYQNIAKARGGECLSQECLNSNAKLKWKCGKGHIWEAKAALVKHGTWCPRCYSESRKTRKPVKQLSERRLLH